MILVFVGVLYTVIYAIKPDSYNSYAVLDVVSILSSHY